MNNRRKLLVALGALAAQFNAFSQQQPAKGRRIGLLSPWTPADAASYHHAFQLGLRNLGWFEGKNISFEYRYAEGKNDRLPELAADLVRLKVDVILASVAPDAMAARNATGTIPIVMASVPSHRSSKLFPATIL